jgi:CPA2 family monovalent cation:H+ antiporter-2
MVDHPLVLSAASSPRFALDLLLVLACAGAVAMVFGRLKLAAIPGYLLAGVLIGPGVLGLVHDAAQIEQISSVAMIVLMFGIGLAMDPAILQRRTMWILLVGVLGTLLSVLSLWPMLRPVTGGWPSALAVAMAMAMSSTAVVLRLLQQRRELNTPAGRLTFGVTFVQDFVAIVFLALMPVLAAASGARPQAGPSGLIQTLAEMSLAVGGVSAMIVFGKLAMPIVLERAARHGGPEVLLVVSAAAALGAGVLTAAVGLSPELGAFTAGFLLSGTRFRYHLAGQLNPLRDLFMAVFFTAMGLKVDLGAVAQLWWVLPVGVVVIPLVKAVCVGFTAWAMGFPASSAARAGLDLGLGGEFSLVLLGAAMTAGVLGSTDTSVWLAVVIATLVLAPLITPLSLRVQRGLSRLGTAPWVRRSLVDGQDDSDIGSNPAPADLSLQPTERLVIIAGYGPVGRACADRVVRLGAACTIIELNPVTVAKQSGRGHRVIYGDAGNPEVLETAGIHRAAAVVLALPDADATLRAVRTIRGLHPSVYIAARTNFLSQATLAKELGASHVTVEEVATASALSEAVSARLMALEAGSPAEPPRSSTPL